MAEKIVKVGRIPGRLFEIGLSDGETVNVALGHAGLTVEDGEEVRLNGEPLEIERLRTKVLEDGDTVLLLKKVKGA